MEYMLIKLEARERNNIIFGTFYRSQSSTVDNRTLYIDNEHPYFASLAKQVQAAET